MSDDDSMNEPLVDLSALDPSRHTMRFEATVTSIAHEAMAARAKRLSTPPDLFVALIEWARPALIAAGVVLAVALSGIAHQRTVHARAGASATDIMGIPPELVALVRSRETPSLVQIHDALASAEGIGR